MFCCYIAKNLDFSNLTAKILLDFDKFRIDVYIEPNLFLLTTPIIKLERVLLLSDSIQIYEDVEKTFKKLQLTKYNRKSNKPALVNRF